LDQPEELVLTSSAFDDGADIPDLYTCRGKNISPPLSWAGAPAGTGDATELAEGVPPGRVLPGGLRQGRNGMFRFGYMGPCPPWGKHRYVLHLFALDAAIDTDRVMNKRRLLRRIEPHILSRARLLGHYARAR
jgi:phosphatidylethanolamine-binding protein (PEBP) family uncharacterized protein